MMPNYLDLFAGAGGLSEGFLRAGYEAVAHIEMDTAACYTLKTRAAYHWLKKNNKLDLYNEYLERKITRDEFYSAIPKSVLDTVLNYEISEDSLETIFSDVDALLNGRNLDLIIGGPPCQAYSIAGRSRAENKMVGDERNYLYKLYAKFLKRYHPKYFVFENVVGLLSAKEEDGTLHLNNMLSLFKQYGYSTEYRQLVASDYGVLQNRKRIILIGYRGERKEFYPEIPKVETRCTVGEIFSDLPKLKAGEGSVLPVATKHYKGSYLYSSGIKESDKEQVTFHQARPHTEQDLEIYRIVAKKWQDEGQRVSYTELPERLRTHKNTKSFHTTIPCIENNTSEKYSVYLAIINGELLAALYEEYRDRLLEKNVRSFLQVKGGVNKGIRDTLRDEPEMFLAYNNGMHSIFIPVIIRSQTMIL